MLPLWGNQTTMNLNTLVLENIVQSSYYKNYLSEITTYQGLIDEIYYNVGLAGLLELMDSVAGETPRAMGARHAADDRHDWHVRRG